MKKLLVSKGNKKFLKFVIEIFGHDKVVPRELDEIYHDDLQDCAGWAHDPLTNEISFAIL